MQPNQTTITPSVLILTLFFVVIVPFLPLLVSWRWGWWEGWVYAMTSILSFAISRFLAARRHPDLIAERARYLQHENPAPWDKRLAPLLGLGGGLTLLVAGLDQRFGWSLTFGISLKTLALTIILVGYVLGSYALICNRFFSGMVRIQAERGHTVVSSGPYRWVRHPGYAGALLTYVATPIFLDSAWAFLPALLLCIVMIVRTSLEDRYLQAELQGYREYAGRVRFRLLPGVW